jgi:maltooligosyltrehalose synthase
MTDIDISKIIEFYQSVNSGYSQYELDNFLIETCPTPARQLIMVMEKILELQDPLLKESSFQNTTTYYKGLAQLNKLVEWYQNVKNPQNVLRQFEAEEPEYWAHTLGRQAAIEILSIGKTSLDTN